MTRDSVNQAGPSSQGIENESAEAQLAALRAAHAKVLERETRIMELIGTTDAEKLVHDIRNVLNERELLRSLADL